MPARADVLVDNTNRITSVVLGNGENVIVTNTGTITANPGINVGNVTAHTIQNSGTIQTGASTGAAIALYSSGTLTGGLTNSGTILSGTTSGIGIGIDNAFVLSGGLTNSGTISGDQFAFYLGNSTLSGNLINTGTMQGFSAIDLSNSSTITGTINNSNTIITSATSGDAASIHIGANARILGGLVNSGTITGNGDYGFGLRISGTVENGVTNSGTLTGNGTDAAIQLAIGGISDGLTNSGTISGWNSILLLNDSTLSGGVNNTNSIFFTATTQDAGGIYLGTSTLITGGITNSGTIAPAAHNGSGIVNRGSIGGGITNTGTIDVSGASVGAGIRFSGGDLSGGLVNSGTIAGFSSIFLANATLYGGVNNQHTLLISASSGDAAGIYINGSTLVTGGITNSGTIMDTANNGFGIHNASTIQGGITNSGTIDAGSSANSINFANASTLTGDIINNGTISGARGIALDNSLATGSIVNTQAIISSYTSSDVAGIFLLLSTLSGGITNSGTITSDVGAGVNMLQSVILGGLTNSGTIEGISSADCCAAGIYLGNTSTLQGLDNNGTIIGWNGVHLNNSTLAGVLRNTQAIISSSTSSDAAGVYMNGTSLITGGITNSGTITANLGYGLRIYSTISGDLINSGTISGSRGFDLASTLNGHIINSGTIISTGSSSGADALHLNGTITGGITNSGTISGIANSILLLGAIIGGEITNSGTISAPIRLLANASLSSLKNSGYIAQRIILNTNAHIANGLTNSGTIDNTVNIVSSVIAGGITNSGTVSSTNAGISLNSHGVITNGLTNSGTITGGTRGIVLYNTSSILGGIVNSGTIASTANDGLDIGLSSIVAGGITNSGLIIGADRGVIFQFSTISGGLTNSGTIRGTNTGLSLVGATLDGLTNSGTVTGITGITLGGVSSTISNGITNSGTIIGTGGTASSFAASSSASLTLNGGRIIGDVIDTTPADGSSATTVTGDFTTEGNFNVSSLTVDANRTLSIATGDVFEAYSSATINGTLRFNIEDTASFGSLVVSNGTANLTNATLAVGLIGNNIAAGDEMRVINASTALTGGPGATPTAISDNSFLWNFVAFDGTQATATTDNTDLFVRALVSNELEETASSPNNQAAATILTSLVSPAIDPTLGQVLQNINNAPTAQAVNDVLESIQPALDAAVTESVTSIAGQSLTIVQSRLDSLRSTGISSGNGNNGFSVWGQGFGQHVRQDERDGIAGYDADIYGFAVGADHEQLLDNTVIGIMMSYGNSDISSDNINHTATTIDSYQFGVYADYDITRTVFVGGALSYGYNDIHSTRHDVGAVAGLNADAEYKAQQISAHLEAGKDIEFSNKALPVITPRVLMNYAHLTTDEYTETGAGGANLNVRASSSNMLELGMAAEARWSWVQKNGALLEPSLHAGYRYDIIGDAAQNTSQFTGGGAAFETQGADPARHIFNTGLGLSYSTPARWTVSAGYDFEVKEDYTSHALVARALYKF